MNKCKTIKKLKKRNSTLTTTKITIYDKPVANIILIGKKTETISSKVRNQTRVFTLSTLTQHSLGIPSQSNKTGRRNKRNTNWKRSSQTLPICR
jgi:hypothetical protein